MRPALLILSTVCLLLAGSTVSAQTYGASAQINDSKFSLPTLSTIPQLHTDMPLDCMIAYIIMDSLVRNATIYQLLDAPTSLSLQNLRFACRLIYGMEEYSHAHMKAHFVATMDSTRSVHDLRPFPANTYMPLIRAIAIDRWREFDPHVRALLLTHYIARIRVVNVAVGKDSSYGNHHQDIRSRVSVTCEVIEKIKGMKLPNNCQVDYPAGQKADRNTALNAVPCIVFSFQQNNIDFIPQIGEEYYAFLMEHSIELTEDYLTVITSGFARLAPGALGSSVGLFKINDGMVEDPRKFWSSGTMPVEQFRTLLQTKIAEIKSWAPAP